MEIGTRAARALARARAVEVVMEFSRGEVWRTDRGEIVWVDCDPEAFSPFGVRLQSRRFVCRAIESGGLATALQTAFEGACGRFVADVGEGIDITLAARQLVGLGHGLTPSGDDFLGGFLFVRHRQGHRDVIDTSATHEISRARLSMHMNGEGTRAEVRFVDALLDGRDVESAAKILRTQGHSSGDDFMRGARAAAGLR